MILNINQLRAFCTMVRHQSVSKAAGELMVTPPAISMQIKHLESALDMKLVARQGHSMRLTPAGENLWEKAKPIFEQIWALENELEDSAGIKVSNLKIGCPQTQAKYLMPQILAAFNSAHPGVHLCLDQGTSSELVENLIQQRNELAIVRNIPNETRFKIKPMFQIELTLVAAPEKFNSADNKISVKQLDSLPLILTQVGSASRNVVMEYLSTHRVRPMVVMESASVDLIKELVGQGQGLGFVVRYAVLDELRKGKLKALRLAEGSPFLDVGVGYVTQRNLSSSAWHFLRFLDNNQALIQRLLLGPQLN
ncbi:hypothetical protein AAU61_07570 [Desulfocarbo indianensis]|nr:hypothetical protein AAU61_07570 [Desulfocarbo indianensis]